MPPPPRTPDKPRSYNPERAKRNILRAATREFAAKGVGGARVDAIAKRAGVNKRMLYHYFGAKEALFLAVLEAEYRRIRDAERDLDLTGLAPVEAMTRLVEFTWQYYLDNPDFLSLLNSENLHRARHLKNSASILEMHSPLVAILRDVLERGVADGAFRDGVDPVELYITIAALGYFYLSNSYTLSVIFDRDLRSDTEIAQRGAHIRDVVLGYLRPGN